MAFNETLTNSAEFGIISQMDFFDHSISKANKIHGYTVVRKDYFVYNPRISVTAPVGPINRNRLGREGVLSPLYTVFSTHDIDATFLEWSFKNNSWHKFMKFNGDSGARSDRFSIKDDVFFRMPILAPKDKDHIEQKCIGKFFEQLDHVITLHQRKLDKLLNIKKSMLDKMFPKNGSKKPEIRFKGFTDDWEQRKLGAFSKEITRTSSNNDSPVMMITASNGFIRQSERYAFDNAGKSLSKYVLLFKGELAYNHGASKIRPFGSCFSLKSVESARIPYVYHCFSVEKSNPEFISMVLNSKEVEKQLRKIVSSGARMDGLLNISFEDYTSVSLMLPRTVEQNVIVNFINNLDSLITLHQRKLEKLKNLKKACLDKMFV